MNNALAQRLAGSAELFFKKHGPAILTSAGVAGFVATNILTGKAVLKSQDKVKDLKFKAQEIKARKEGDALVKYDNRKRAEDLGRLWVVDGFEVVKDFAPAIVVGAASVICVISSHRMMQNKQASLVAAYAALDAGYRAYRARVRDLIGEEQERNLYRVPAVTTTEERIEGVEGNSLLKCELDYDEKLPSPYSFYFDEYNPNWNKNTEYNKFFLSQAQNWFNGRLQGHGFVFLNEVLEHLGFERTQMGQIVGWRKDAKEKGTGDGYIDFGIFDVFNDNSRAFVNGQSDVVLLDFNVDGPITI